MTEFPTRYADENWFSVAANYLRTRRRAIQDRLVVSFRFTELTRENEATFSYEFSSILRDAGSVFASVSDSLVKGVQANSSSQTNFAHYRQLLITEDPDIYRRSVQVRALFPRGLLVPLSALSDPNGRPHWWEGYNNVKHSEYENFRDGNLRNAVLAVGALVILEHFLGIGSSDSLWVNVGIRYANDSADMSSDRRLFFDGGGAA